MGEGSPLWSWPPWRGRGESPSEIGSISLSLSVSVFCSAALSPFLLYPEIHNSDWNETFAMIFFRKLAFLRPKKDIDCLTGGPRGSGARPGGGARPLPRAHLGHRFALIFLPDFPSIPKISSVHFYPVWIPSDMDILRNIKHATDRNWHWINMLVPKIV